MYRELKNHVHKLLEQDRRIDGRGLLDYRDPVKVEFGVSETAEGSALVQIGDTQVIAGVKLGLEKPFPDTPDKGNIMVNVELVPLSSSEFEPGPPGIQAIELSRVIDRGIRESKMIDVHKLVVEPGEKVWTVSVDLVVINEAGNLFDACSLAAIAALKHTVFPSYEDDKLDYSLKSDKKLPLEKEAVSVTVHKIGNKLIVDPTDEEEKVSDSRLTVAVTKDSALSALQKGGGPISIEDVDNMVTIAKEKAAFLRERLR